MYLDVRYHLLAHEGAQIEVLAGIGRTHQAAQFHRSIGGIRDLKTANPSIPEIRTLDDPLQFLPNLIHRHGVIEVEKNCAHDVRAATCPILKRLVNKVGQGHDHATLVPDPHDHKRRQYLLATAPLAFDNY